MAETFDELTQKKCRSCIVCGKPENDGLLPSDDPWICVDCRFVLGQVRGLYLRRIKNKETQETRRYGITRERGRLLMESWFCNFCPNKGQPCQDTVKSERECLTKKLDRVARYLFVKEFPSVEYMFISHIYVGQTQEACTCSYCGRQMAAGTLMGKFDGCQMMEQEDGEKGKEVMKVYSLCPTCMRMLDRKIEKEEEEKKQIALELAIKNEYQ